MKFDSTYKGRGIVTAVKGILSSSKSEKSPVIIIWDDTSISHAKLLQYLSSNKRYHFLNFGIACSGAFILDEFYHQLTSQRCRFLNPDLKARAISRSLRTNHQSFVFVVNNCHLIGIDQISWLTGLMFEFDWRARFIFLFHRDHLHKMTRLKKAKDPRVQFFLKQIKVKYVTND